MSKRHTHSRSFMEKPKFVHVLFADDGKKYGMMTWHKVTEEDAEVLVQVLRAEGKDFAVTEAR